TIFAALTADVTGRGVAVAGDRFMRAIALSVDMAATLGVAAKSPIRFFRPANAGIFGATLGLCFLRELSREQMKDALGYALAFNSGTMQAHIEGKPALPVQIGNAARGAIMAADLAENGMPGPHDSLEGPYAYFSLFEEEVDTAGLASALGKTWRICEVSHKPYPTGRAAQGGIYLAQQAWAQGLAIDDVCSVELSAPPLINRLVGRPYQKEMSANYARLCFAYSGAIALMNGTVRLSDFDISQLRHPSVEELAAKINITVNDVTDPAAFGPQVLTIKLRNAQQVQFKTDALFGSPEIPMSQEDQVSKVDDCLRFGFQRQDIEAHREKLLVACHSLDTMSDVRNLLDLMTDEEGE
ncbi:MAG: MmgE/PrpD family protein, partial [Pseudomonadota bacterium]